MHGTNLTHAQIEDLRWRIQRATRDARPTADEVFDATVEATTILIEGGSVDDAQKAIDERIPLHRLPRKR